MALGGQPMEKARERRAIPAMGFLRPLDLNSVLGCAGQGARVGSPDNLRASLLEMGEVPG